MQRISDITQTGSRAREREDHLSLTVFQLQDETSVSGVRQKKTKKKHFSPNCLVNPEVVRAGAELCKRRRDEANSTTSLWWGQSGFTDASERSGYPGGMEWRGGGGCVAEAEQEMIRHIWGGKRFEMLRCCWDGADLGLDKSVQAVTHASTHFVASDTTGFSKDFTSNFSKLFSQTTFTRQSELCLRCQAVEATSPARPRWQPPEHVIM